MQALLGNVSLILLVKSLCIKKKKKAEKRFRNLNPSSGRKSWNQRSQCLRAPSSLVLREAAFPMGALVDAESTLRD